MRQAWFSIRSVDRFIRLHQLFFTAVWLLLGAASVDRNLRLRDLGLFMGVVLCFHVFTYVLNDVIDLPIDRTQPQRQDDPLVRGTIRPGQALLIVWFQPALAAVLTLMIRPTPWAYGLLAAGMGLMAAYNRWGKRCAFPPITDAIQGCAWASLAIYAPLALGMRPGAMSWLTAGYVAVFTLLFNGIHGSLRDLKNDLATGARTTAIVMGARPAGDSGNPSLPPSVAAYASVILAALIGLGVAMVVRNDFAYGPVAWSATVFAVGAEALFAIILHPLVVRPRGSTWDTAWRLQLYVLMMIPATAFATRLGIATLAALVLLNLLALALFGCTARVAGWAWRALRSLVQQPGEGRLVPDLPRTD